MKILKGLESEQKVLNSYLWQEMNEWCIYIELYCVLLYTQSALQSCVCVFVCVGGVSPQPPSVYSTHLDECCIYNY